MFPPLLPGRGPLLRGQLQEQADLQMLCEQARDVLPRGEWQLLATAAVKRIGGEGGHVSPGWCCSRGLPTCSGIARVDEVFDT
jgi:hypothetical protein